MKLNELADNPGARKSRMRVGRGIGSGKGKTCGRGHKGQGSRTGVSNMGEGGQTPLYMRVPKRGFSNINRKEIEVVNLEKLEQLVESKKIDGGKAINREVLVAAGVIKSKTSTIKILGKAKAKLTIEADHASKSAAESLEKAGGKITFIPKKAPRPNQKQKAKKDAA